MSTPEIKNSTWNSINKLWWSRSHMGRQKEKHEEEYKIMCNRWKNLAWWLRIQNIFLQKYILSDYFCLCMTVFPWAVAIISNKSLFPLLPTHNLFFTEQTASSFKPVHFQNTPQWLPMQAANENPSLSGRRWQAEPCPDPQSLLLLPLGCPLSSGHTASSSLKRCFHLSSTGRNFLAGCWRWPPVSWLSTS